MKKTKSISLVLLTTVLLSCQSQEPKSGWEKHNVHMRSDTTAPYTRTHGGYYGMGLLYYYAFRPYGVYNYHQNGYGGYSSGGYYSRSGYYNNNLSQKSNVGTNGVKSNTIRGGFGRSGMTVSS